MTVKILKELFEKYDIPEDVTLMSDSGWECDPTDMDGVYYNEKEKLIVFTQYPCTRDNPYNNNYDWELLYGEYAWWDTDDERFGHVRMEIKPVPANGERT